jgi:hypothetical protein
MKLILIFFTIFCPILKASEIIRWETDYYPNFGRVMITYLDQERVLLEEDRNSCVLDNFGNVTACTLMAPIITIDSISLMLQSEQFSLYQFLNAKHLRLVRGSGMPKILKIDEESGGVLLALRLHPNIISTPDYLKIQTGK